MACWIALKWSNKDDQLGVDEIYIFFNELNPSPTQNPGANHFTRNKHAYDSNAVTFFCILSRNHVLGKL
jgi:hypothetical protein